MMRRSNETAAAAAETQGPPMSNPLMSVWYWLLDGRPTTLMYHKPKKEVWCNGYLLDTYVSIIYACIVRRWTNRNAKLSMTNEGKGKGKR